MIAEVWPTLELYMHGGVSFTPYKEQFKKLIGKDINYLEMYNASEGFFAARKIQVKMVCCYFSIMDFYEFMPVERIWKKTTPNHRAAGCGNCIRIMH